MCFALHAASRSRVRNRGVQVTHFDYNRGMDIEALSSERAAEIRNAVKSKYREVAKNPDGHFAYPIGDEGAVRLGYARPWTDSVPETAAKRFVGVGNPFSIRVPQPGDQILDAGCGCGFDTFVAASMAGMRGRAIGIDLTAEMLKVARSASEFFKCGNAEFLKGTIEQLPFEDACFDMVISNGALNLIPDKPIAFKEIARVLRPKGSLIAADLVVIETIPAEVLASTDAWST
jgi:arsenite methyltransferase